MFLEKDTNSKSRTGWIEVVAKQRVQIFKPQIDKRYSEENVVSHDANTVASIPVQSASQILFYSNEYDVVGVDEAQFFDDELASVCEQLANAGVRVIVAGLDMDFQGKPFGPIPALLAKAEYVTKVHAICMQCGNLAQYSHRKVEGNKLVMLGETETYEPLCRKCFNEAGKVK